MAIWHRIILVMGSPFTDCSSSDCTTQTPAVCTIAVDFDADGQAVGSNLQYAHLEPH